MEEKLKDILQRAAGQILPSREQLIKILQSGKKLRIYHGIDPTGPNLHLGHTTNFLILKRFQELGHKIIFLIGDFTAMIGDPTGKFSARKQQTRKEVLENAKGYIDQVSKIINFKGTNPVEVRYNSEWLSKLSLEDWFRLAALVTYQQLVERDMFQARITKKKDIFLHEFFYPLMQAYDSVVLDVDMEIGGTDQMFNMLMGRRLMKKLKNKEKFIITTKLLINTKTGKKLMNKSEGTYISLGDKPDQMYGKTMSLPDEVVFECLNLCTDVNKETVEKAKKLSIFEAKKLLAKTLVAIFHSPKEADEAKKKFEEVFQKGVMPKEAPTISFKTFTSLPTISEVILRAGVLKSKSEVKRLIEAGAIEDEEGKINNLNQMAHEGVYKIGKYRFLKITK